MFSGRTLSIIFTADYYSRLRFYSFFIKSECICEKVNSLIFGISDLKGKTLAPPGKIWSVVILSPTLIIISASILLFIGAASGKGLIPGPRII